MTTKLGSRVAHPDVACVVNPVALVLDLSETQVAHTERMFEYVQQGLREAARRNANVAERVRVAGVLITDDRATPADFGNGPGAFVTIGDVELGEPPPARGVTPLGDAVDTALDLIEKEQARLSNAGQMRGVGTLLVASDFVPTDHQGMLTGQWRVAAERAQRLRSIDQMAVTVGFGFGDIDSEVARGFAGDLVFAGDLPQLSDVIQIATLSIDRAQASVGQGPADALGQLIDLEFAERYPRHRS